MQRNLLKKAISQDTFAIPFGHYGHFTFNIALLALRVLEPFGISGDSSILIALRSVSLVSTWATGVFLFGWLARTGMVRGGRLAVLALIASPLIAMWSAAAHPDTAQMLLVAVTLAALHRMAGDQGWRSAAVAGACAGLAFATKYIAMLFLPLIALVVIMRARRPTVSAAAQPAVVSRWTRIACAGGAALALIAAPLVQPEIAARWLTQDGLLPATLTPAWFAQIRTVVYAIGGALALAAALPHPWRLLSHHLAVSAVISDLAAAAAGFLLTFAVVSPYSWWRLEFLKGILFVQGAIGASERSSFADAAYQWATAAGDLGLMLMLGGAAGAALAWLSPAPASEPRCLSAIALSWGLMTLMFIVLAVGSVRHHYLLPVAPALAVLIATGSHSRSRAGVVAITVASAAVGFVDLQRTLGIRSSRLAFATSDPIVVAGNELLEVAGPNVSVLYDLSSYVPPEIRAATGTWGGTMQQLRDLNPDVVVIHKLIRESSSDCSWRTGDALRKCEASSAYYVCVETGTCGYRFRLERGLVRLYFRDGR